MGRVAMDVRKTQILEFLSEEGKTLKDISADAKLTVHRVRQILEALVNEGRVEVSGAVKTGKRGRPAKLFRVVEVGNTYEERKKSLQGILTSGLATLALISKESGQVASVRLSDLNKLVEQGDAEVEGSSFSLPAVEENESEEAVLSPEDYTQFYSNWKAYCSKFIRVKFPENRVDEVYHEFFAYSIEKQMLEKFDPERGVKWTTWLNRCLWNFLSRVGKKNAKKLDNEFSLEGASEASGITIDNNPLLDSGLDTEGETVFGDLLDKVKERLAKIGNHDVEVWYDLPGGGREKGTRSALTLLRLYELGYKREEILQVMDIKNIHYFRRVIQEEFQRVS